MNKVGKLYLISVGPGKADLIPPLAIDALRQSEIIIGYELYFKWIQEWIQGKEIHSPPLTKERERGQMAIEFARQGRMVGLISSGDIGIYAMAAVVMELMEENDVFDLEVIPGISAANSCASLLGSPLSHDFATLSLSDLLCPRELIEERARHLSKADMVTVLYNVQSQKRREGIYRILEIFLEYKKPETLCGVVRNAYREDQRLDICTLADLAKKEFDMFTSIIIGNRLTRKKRLFLYTPRGYTGDFATQLPGTSFEKTVKPLDSKGENCIWVFSGTSDGNALAREIAAKGYYVVISTASEYGREVAIESCPNIKVRAGRMGTDTRRKELADSKAAAIVDATHPYATEISKQLIQLSKELEIPYIRYERPSGALDTATVRCADASSAAKEAIRLGKRVFLATGIKTLSTFLEQEGSQNCEWFVRVTPDFNSVKAATRSGVPRKNILAMQGPFSKEFNQILWTDWKIDCVVTKDSGDAGGFQAKAEAAKEMNIPFIVIDRIPMEYPLVMHTFPLVMSQLDEIFGMQNLSSGDGSVHRNSIA